MRLQLLLVCFFLYFSASKAVPITECGKIATKCVDDFTSNPPTDIPIDECTSVRLQLGLGLDKIGKCMQDNVEKCISDRQFRHIYSESVASTILDCSLFGEPSACANECNILESTKKDAYDAFNSVCKSKFEECNAKSDFTTYFATLETINAFDQCEKSLLVAGTDRIETLKCFATEELMNLCTYDLGFVKEIEAARLDSGLTSQTCDLECQVPCTEYYDFVATFVTGYEQAVVLDIEEEDIVDVCEEQILQCLGNIEVNPPPVDDTGICASFDVLEKGGLIASYQCLGSENTKLVCENKPAYEEIKSVAKIALIGYSTCPANCPSCTALINAYKAILGDDLEIDACIESYTTCMEKFDSIAYTAALTALDKDDICGGIKLSLSSGQYEAFKCVFDELPTSCNQNTFIGSAVEEFKNGLAEIECPQDCKSDCEDLLELLEESGETSGAISFMNTTFYCYVLLVVSSMQAMLS